MDINFADFPLELQNIILQYRATVLLQKICSQYYLDFDKLCDFLKKYQGVITGSCSIACFIPGFLFHDIDIFILKGNDRTIKPYHDFLPIFTLDNTDEVIIDKCPLHDPLLLIEPPIIAFDYKYVYKYRNLQIDMNVYPRGTYNHMKELGETNYDLDCCKIMFDGDKWILPQDNILHFIQSRTCQITLSGVDFFSQIYDGVCSEEYTSKPDDYTQYIITNIIKNYSDLKLTTILQKPVSDDYERIWFWILNVFLDEKIINNYKSLVDDTHHQESLITFLNKNNKITKKENFLHPVECPYAHAVLSKFLFRIIKYTLRGFVITNLSVLAEGFPPNIVNQLVNRAEESKVSHQDDHFLPKWEQ